MDQQFFKTIAACKELRYTIRHSVLIGRRMLGKLHLLLFQKGAVYIEVVFNQKGDEIITYRKFSNMEELDPYLQDISLPEFFDTGWT